MVNFRHCLFVFLGMLILTAIPASAQRENVTELTGQLTVEALQALNNGQAEIYTDSDRVTFVTGTCTTNPINNTEDAEKVVSSMIGLLGGDGRTRFEYWRTLTDASGNHYYVFQQVYANTTVLGGAVKVITDADGEMIGLTSSIESELPEEGESEGITVEEAEQLVLRHWTETNHPEPTIIDGSSAKMILPVMLTMDEIMEDESSDSDSSRFVWVVYTNNPEDPARSGADLPYLAHYVTMDGEYLYCIETIMPGDAAGESGFSSAYVFEFMEPVDYAGYVDLSDGSEMELTVTVMRDKRTGMYYLGNIERQIVVADAYEFLYNNGRVVLASSPDNMEWDQAGLLSLYNFCKVWDFYSEIGWIGGDGKGTPILILNDFCDENYNRINNAAYAGNYLGWSVFAMSLANDFSQALDVIAHEFTHCVTHSVMTYNAYLNDYGAINEAISDILGQICDLMNGNEEDTNWVIGDKSQTPVRSMSDPNRGNQPAFSWDLYYMAPVSKPTSVNDNGGVHSNSSLLNNIAYRLVTDGGMTLEDARAFWFAVDCAMVPGTDHAQLRELLPWLLITLDMDQYTDTLERAIDTVRLGNDTIPDFFDDDRVLVTLTLPDNENFTDDNWMMQIISLDVHGLIDEAKLIIDAFKTGDYSIFPQDIQDILNKEDQTAAEPTPEPEKPGFWEVLFTSLAEILAEGQDEPKTTAEPEPDLSDQEINAIMTWIREELTKLFYMGSGAAGPDGRTIRMVTRPGRTVPMLIHMAFDGLSTEPDQMVCAIYWDGRWYEVDISGVISDEEASEKAEKDFMDNPLAQAVSDKLIENIWHIRSLDDLLDLFTTEIPGGQTLELPSTTLEDIVLPAPRTKTESEDTTPADRPEPGKKSRPKQ